MTASLSFTDLNAFTRTTFGQAFGRTLDVLFERLDLFAIIAILMYIPFTLLQMTLVAATKEDNESLWEVDKDHLFGREEEDILSKLQSKCWLLVSELAFNGIVGIIGQAAMTLAVARIYLEQTDDVHTVDVLKEGMGHFAHLLCAAALALLGIGTIAAIVSGVVLFALYTVPAGMLLAAIIGAIGAAAGLYIWVSLWIVIPVIVVERRGPLEGIQRAWELAGGHRCYIFCTMFCLSTAVSLVSMIVSEFLFDGVFGTFLKNLPFLFSFPVSGM